jgi:predicted ATP-grasp superfamily ATP-dependent carboligase
MRILVSGARMPFALAVLRSLGKAGHEIVATDSVPRAPALHSHYVREHVVTVAPRDDPRRYVDQILDVYRDHAIELHVPTFEEVFYLAAHLDELERQARVNVTALPALQRLHDKAAFVELCGELGLRIPRTVVVEDRDQLGEAAGQLAHFLARPVYSRGAQDIYTNTGPRAGRDLADCDPSSTNPWLVQEYVEGTDLCSYSVCHAGRLACHVAYAIPIQIGHAYGVRFESVDVPETRAVAERVARQCGFTGHLSFDYKLDGDGVCLIECNPRATNGALLVPPEELAGAIVDGADGQVQVAPAGREAQIDFGVAAEVLYRGITPRQGLQQLLSVRDAYADRGDLLPELYQYLQFVHDARLAHRERISLMDALQDDTCWDGTPIS